MMHISKANVFGLINAIGTETTGAISFHSTPDEPEETLFREIPEQELIDRIQKRQQTPITVWDDKPRLSVAGVQEKLPVMITDDGKYGLGEGDFASTHILKFGKHPDEYIVLNEHLCMTLARRLMLPAAETDTLISGLDLSGDESDFATELISLLKANAKWYIEVAKELPNIRQNR